MEKAAWAFTWLGWFIAVTNRIETAYPTDPREA